MASNGLLNRAKKGTCRMCLRVRNTENQVGPVGEVHWGFACGYTWQCINAKDCEDIIQRKLEKYQPGTFIHEKIKHTIELGRF